MRKAFFLDTNCFPVEANILRQLSWKYVSFEILSETLNLILHYFESKNVKFKRRITLNVY